MIIIPAALPSKIVWDSENGKWKIVVKVDKEPGHDYLYSWMVIQKLCKNGQWRIENSPKHYPAYLKEKIKEFDVAIRSHKKEYLEGRKSEVGQIS